VQRRRKVGYHAFVGPRTDYTDGLLTFVKKAILDDTRPLRHRMKAFESLQPREYWAAEKPSKSESRGFERKV
jgi:hypothetical protein